MTITPELHLIPPKLKLQVLPLNLYLLTIMEDKEQVGLNKIQFTTRMPMSFGLILVLENRLSKASYITCFASSLAMAMDGRGVKQCIASCTYVSSPTFASSFFETQETIDQNQNH